MPGIGNLVVSLLLSTCVTGAAVISQARCKCFPGDSCWPDPSKWQMLSKEVGGRLVMTEPIGAPCHEPKYNSKACKRLQDKWTSEELHMESSSSIMQPFFAAQACDPFTPRDRKCQLGNYVVASVAARNADDIVKGVNFARENNIRLVVRNTGHDYLGRSTGAGALGIWTHMMKDIQYIPQYRSADYNGKAFKVGAGVQGFEIAKFAHSHGLVAVTGECPTVGIAGGYTQGGGHSALSTNYGLAADNVLEWEVVTADGRKVRAAPDENPDLFYALSGGGAGNWGVVTSMTIRAFEDKPTGSLTLTMKPSSTKNPGDWWKAIQAFHDELPNMVDKGALVIYYFGSNFLKLSPMSGFGLSSENLSATILPFLLRLKEYNVKVTVQLYDYPSYYDFYDASFGPLPIGNIQVGIDQYGGRLIPRDAIGKIQDLSQFVASRNVTWIGVGTDVSRFARDNKTAVLPAWRRAIVHATLVTPWDNRAPWSEMLRRQDVMTTEVMPRVEAATPGSGSYLNEGDLNQPNWKQVFFGDKYDKLLQIKNKWDPEGLFYTLKAVNSDRWRVETDGRLCPAQAPSERRFLMNNE